MHFRAIVLSAALILVPLTADAQASKVTERVQRRIDSATAATKSAAKPAAKPVVATTAAAPSLETGNVRVRNYGKKLADSAVSVPDSADSKPAPVAAPTLAKATPQPVSRPKPVAQLPMVWHRFVRIMVTRHELAEAYRTNDRKILNADCMVFVRRANEKWSDLHLKTCADLANHIENETIAIVCPPDVGVVGFDRVNGTKIDSKLKRHFSIDEMCLYNPNMGRWEASLSCGNFINGKLSVASAMKETRTAEAPKPTSTGPAVNLNPSKTEEVKKPLPTITIDSPGWWDRNWKAVALGITAAGTAYAIYRCAETHCIGASQEQTVIVYDRMVVPTKFVGIGLRIPTGR